ncbi:hypothetical protein [Variovorax sp. JS1663]|uniref:hypothetical protein n=1 Tax=Variovorax sp. JS1663 TaxID=1851577 RepID=UPI000B349620|nr:hypothetical protein [Variovorax sp. JS1663]
MTNESANENLKNAQFLHLDRKIYDGWLLGDGVGAFEGGWWIAVQDLKTVFQFYPNQVITPQSTGLPLVCGYDFKRTYDQLRDDDVAMQFFADARDPSQLVGLVRTFDILST